jgi:hypothetical protein
MTKDLVKRLHKGVMCGDDPIIEEAANRIEALESELVQAFNHMMNDTNLFDEASDRIEKLEAALREIIGALNDPKGGQHVYDMRNASYIARKALEGKDE